MLGSGCAACGGFARKLTLENQPPESSPFWEAVNCWYRQGKVTEQVCGETFAKWVKPTPERMIHIGGNHYMLDTSKLKNEPPKGRD